MNLDNAYLVVAATVTDIAGKTKIQDFTKTRRTRRVSLEPRLIELLQEHRRQLVAVASVAGVTIAHDGFIFTRSADGTEPINPGLLTTRLKRISQNLDTGEYDITLQAIRHWTQTTLTEAGHNSRQVALEAATANNS